MNKKLLLFIFMLPLFMIEVYAEGDRPDSLTSKQVNVINFADKVSDSPTVSIDDVLSGRVSGVYIQKWSGSPGVQSLISIRNAGTLNSQTTPLIVIDGIPIFENPSVFTDINPLSVIPVEEVESVEILKDANALALYGARGANGVVIITTKQGKGKNAVHINLTGGTNFIGDNMLNPVSGDTERDRVMSLYDKRNMLYPYDEVGYPSFVADSLNSFYNATNDWQKEYFDVRPVFNVDLALTGSGNYGFYRLYIGVLSDKGVKKDNSFNRYNFGLNTRYNITKSFTFDFRLNASMADREQSFTNLFEPSYYRFNDDKRYFPSLAFATDNEKLNENNNKYIFINSALNFVLSENVTLKSQFGVNTETYKSKVFIPSTLDNGVISSYSASAMRQRFSNRTFASWDKDWGKRRIVADLGFEYIYSIYDLIDVKGEASGSGFSDYVKTVGSNYSQPDISGGSDKYKDALMSFYLDTKFNLTNSFQFLATIRVDGTSAFENDRWNLFPALGAKWELINNSNAFLSFLNLRTNVGKSGYLDNANNIYMGSTLSQGSYLYEEGPLAIYPDNDDINFPKTTQFELGVDLMFGKRTGVSFDWFSKKTSDYIFPVNMPSFSGYDYKYVSGFDVSNSGIELTLNSKIIDRTFSWTTAITIAYINSTITDIPDDNANSTRSFLNKEASLTSIYAFEANGYYKADGSDLPSNAGYGSISFQPGLPKIVDKNGDGVITDQDMVVIADWHPSVFGGFTNLFSYKKWYLDTHLSYGLGGEIVKESQTERYADNQYSHSLFKDEKANTNFYFMTTERDIENDLVIQGVSSIQDASFLRFEKLSLGYNLKWGKVFVTGTNLFVLTNYDRDPHENFNGVNRFDLATTGTPRFKTVVIGLRIKL